MADSNDSRSGPVPAANQRAAAPAAGQPAIDPVAVIRSKAYIGALVLAAIVGIPISAIAYGFLALVAAIQQFLFTTLPEQLFGSSAPAWWPLPWLALSGLLTAMTIRYLPGNGGHSPAFGFQTGGGPATGRELPGIALAAIATLSLGAVLGPEAPLIALGGGLGALAVHLAKKDAPPMAATIMASAGSFAAISTLLGSPVLGAFLIMEVAGIGGAMLSLVTLPGLLASGIGALVFVGLDNWTGLGTFSLALPAVPPAVPPTLATMAWALVMGAMGALLGWLIRSLGLWLRPIVHLNRVLVTAGLGLLIGLIAMAYQLISGHSFTQVLFSGQDALPELVEDAADYSLGVVVLLILCKALAYGLSLSAFRGGPVFPSMFIGAAMVLQLGCPADFDARAHLRRAGCRPRRRWRLSCGGGRWRGVTPQVVASRQAFVTTVLGSRPDARDPPDAQDHSLILILAFTRVSDHTPVLLDGIHNDLAPIPTMMMPKI
jgi:H+/Cl- antiporter ClcA